MKKVLIPLLVAIIGAVGVIVAAAISHNPPTPPTPPPSSPSVSIPALHGSYSGSMLRSDGRSFNFTITSLNEDQNGGFTAQGYLGQCPASFSGTVYSNNSLGFYGNETTAGGYCSGTTDTFRGEVYPDGHIAGTWDVENVNASGTWQAS